MDEIVRDAIRDSKTSAIDYVFLEKIEKAGVLTGSSVFGGYIEGTSDVDYLILCNDAMEFYKPEHAINIPHDYEDEIYWAFYYKSPKGGIINIILFAKTKDRAEETYNIWVEATRAMLLLRSSSHVFRRGMREDKQNRVMLFEALKASINSMNIYHNFLRGKK